MHAHTHITWMAILKMLCSDCIAFFVHDFYLSVSQHLQMKHKSGFGSYTKQYVNICTGSNWTNYDNNTELFTKFHIKLQKQLFSHTLQ